MKLYRDCSKRRFFSPLRTSVRCWKCQIITHEPYMLKIFANFGNKCNRPLYKKQKNSLECFHLAVRTATSGSELHFFVHQKLTIISIFFFIFLGDSRVNMYQENDYYNFSGIVWKTELSHLSEKNVVKYNFSLLLKNVWFSLVNGACRIHSLTLEISAFDLCRRNKSADLMFSKSPSV